MKHTILPLVALLAACNPPPETSELFQSIDIEVVDQAGISTAFVDKIEEASDSLHVALPRGEDTAISDAIIERWGAGVDVEVIADYDERESDAIADLIVNDVPVTLADRGLGYFDFAFNEDVAWDGSQTLMSHAFVIEDAESLVSATSAGGLGAGARVLVSARGEDLIDDTLTEQNQIFGGVDATAVTAFNASQKSVADVRWAYQGNSDAVIEMWFGPQERLTKRIIDAIYGARASVWVVTDAFNNDGIAKALQDKAELTTPSGEAAFDVRIVVGPNFDETEPQARHLVEEADDVRKRQLTSAGYVPTVVIIDQGSSAVDPSYATAPRAFVLSHDLVSARRLEDCAEPFVAPKCGSDDSRPVLTDQLIDGTLWVVDDWGESSAEMQTLQALFDSHWEEGDSL